MISTTIDILSELRTHISLDLMKKTKVLLRLIVVVWKMIAVVLENGYVQ